MLVYGIQCAPGNLIGLPSGTVADYYIDYGLLVFPTYSRPLGLDAHNRLNRRFWANVKEIVEGAHKVHPMEFEHPYISDDEDDAVKALQEVAPGATTHWFYVPRVATPESAPKLTVKGV